MPIMLFSITLILYVPEISNDDLFIIHHLLYYIKVLMKMMMIFIINYIIKDITIYVKFMKMVDVIYIF
jgi:hypothetical protein